LRANETSVSILDGQWVYDSARSRPVDPDVKITRSATGTLRAEGLLDAPVQLSPEGDSTWHASGSKDTFTLTLAGMKLRDVRRGRLPDGSPFERTVVYERRGQGDGPVGSWRSIKIDTGSTFDAYVFSVASDGVVTWRIPTDLQVITGRFDGGDLVVFDPKGPTGSTVAIKAAGPRRFDYVIKIAGQPSQRGSITVSRDRRWLTDLSWDVGHPARKSALVYKRD
jgi:hypothetical protein